MTFAVIGGTAFSVGRYIFPNSSPVFHRQVVYSGIVQKGETGQFILTTYDGAKWKLKPKQSINLEELVNRQVVVTGNLTAEPYLIELSELIINETPSGLPTYTQASINTQNTLTSADTNQNLLPNLYPELTWETTQKKLLIFTSGKRRIELEGVYLESVKLNVFPQDFLDYYTNQLTQAGFKQTLNSKTADDITQSFEKDGLYLTYGVENLFSGSGNLKKIVGYRAYLEHN